MKYGEAIKLSMENLAQDEKTIFIGYNISYGSKGYGTLANIPESKKLETPLAENLMIGLAMGMALEGFKPVLFFERHDFMLIALDGIVNHLDKLETMSEGQFKMPVIIRAAVGSSKPLDPGMQHTQDFSEIFKKIVKNIDVYEPKTPLEVIGAYEIAKSSGRSAIIIERKDLYNWMG
ncbi:MAG: hypothetical protein ABIA78_02445 [archaeon]